ncbi:MAG: hypothetical protein U0903_12775 [Planctomycetales bacterium]
MRPSSPSLRIGLSLFSLFVTFLARGDEHLSRFAHKTTRPAGAPRPSDICFSSRWKRPLNKNDPHETFAAAKSFHATRIDWSYTRTPEFVREVKKHGYGYFGTISAELDGTTNRTGRDKSYHGEIVGNPELDFLAARGDISSPEYRNLVLATVKNLLDGGADGIYVDDPGMTYHNAVHNHGGYGDASLAKFRTFLPQNSTPDQRQDWGLPVDLTNFDYAAYVRDHQGKPPAALHALFFEFHRQAVDEFYQWLHKETNKFAGGTVPFACNNWSSLLQDEFPFRQHFNFWIGETSVQYSHPSPQRLYEKTKHAETLGKLQCFSPPNDGLDLLPTRESYVSLARKIVATSYACGSCTLVPWDVWRRGPKTERFFGTRDEFGDLYDLVATHPPLFNNYEEVSAFVPDRGPVLPPGLKNSPVTITSTSQEILLTVRAIPNNPHAPVLIHLVDWSETHPPLSLTLRNAPFGGSANAPLKTTLYIPGQSPTPLKGKTTDSGTETQVDITRISPWAILAVESPDSAPKP